MCFAECQQGGQLFHLEFQRGITFFFTPLRLHWSQWDSTVARRIMIFMLKVVKKIGISSVVNSHQEGKKVHKVKENHTKMYLNPLNSYLIELEMYDLVW